MNQAHLHMILVHIPIVLMPTATLVLVMGLLRKQPVVTNVALAIFTAGTLLTIPAFLLGEGAEEIVESIAGISKQTIGDHEDIADVAFWITVITGLQALATYVTVNILQHLHPTMLKALALLGTLSSILLAYAAYIGGQIRHPEAYAPTAQSAGWEEHDE